jgi:DNA repair photolyase
VLLRLPYELKGLFRDWLDTHLPLKAAHVMSLIQQSRGGRDNDPQFGLRMKGTGQFAELIAKRFALARRRYGLERTRTTYDPAVFRVPPAAGDQISLF